MTTMAVGIVETVTVIEARGTVIGDRGIETANPVEEGGMDPTSAVLMLIYEGVGSENIAIERRIWQRRPLRRSMNANKPELTLTVHAAQLSTMRTFHMLPRLLPKACSNRTKRRLR